MSADDRALDLAREAMAETIEAARAGYGRLYRETRVLPLCKRFGLRYYEGNGQRFWQGSHGKHIESWDLPEGCELREALEAINEELCEDLEGADLAAYVGWIDARRPCLELAREAVRLADASAESAAKILAIWINEHGEPAEDPDRHFGHAVASEALASTRAHCAQSNLAGAITQLKAGREDLALAAIDGAEKYARDAALCPERVRWHLAELFYKGPQK